jgi:hypothetical protein
MMGGTPRIRLRERNALSLRQAPSSCRHGLSAVKRPGPHRYTLVHRSVGERP